ncbi:MAG: hypothetical protein LKF53_05375 [Solobacterium sp.]|jgi:alanyl-tRNA synthetase/misacylated tRNA(Ala) deacylase|nr:hypothetical protein [Solobacterium sp.]MCH4227445.1 hypothetical protein [Solobacterium sp.]MCH4282869.1 hypothetical protein [Solobacterium sp.]
MPAYYEHPEWNELDTAVKETVALGDQIYLRFEDTIFYAQGGGQKSDRGSISAEGTAYPLIKCIKDEHGDPLALIDSEHPEELLGKKVHLTLDRPFRETQMKLHTSLHLLHMLIEKHLGHDIENPITSDIEEDFAFNKYKNAVVEGVDFQMIAQEMNELTAQDIPVVTWSDEKDPHFRYWKCMDTTIPCGGIHVKNLKEIGPVSLVFHSKKGNMTVQVRLG